jgi:NADH:ubiquinone oxidoreductase subunit 4 (subunit M)
MLGVFMSLDFFLFYLFWEVMLVPMYFLIGVWGSDRRLYAAIKFFLYTLAGSVLMLLAILALYYRAHEVTGGRSPSTFRRCWLWCRNSPRHLQQVPVLGIFLRLCHQGADVPVSHLAA